MRKHILTLVFYVSTTVTVFAQWTTNGDNVTIDKNIGIGTTTPTVKLDVNGDIKGNTLHLRSVNPGNSWVYSNIYYPGHSLIIGSPEGNWSLNNVELKPGGSTLGPIYTTFGIYRTPTVGVYERKILLHPQGNTYFNGGNVGIGTENPEYKLDINGDIRASTLSLKSINPGSSYVYSHIYYPGHSLIIGSPEGNWSLNNIELKPGGSTLGPIYSTLGIYSTPAVGVYERKILLHPQGNSYLNGGNVGIGTDNPQHKLDVLGTIRATEVKIESAWADFVFDKDYKLPTLQEVEAHINEYQRLPDIPSEQQVKEEGVNIGEMQAKLLQKIEELTLYMINQDKVMKEQSLLIKEQGELIQTLQKQIHTQ